jgi:hypothetical protein
MLLPPWEYASTKHPPYMHHLLAIYSHPKIVLLLPWERATKNIPYLYPLSHSYKASLYSYLSPQSYCQRDLGCIEKKREEE